MPLAGPETAGTRLAAFHGLPVLRRIHVVRHVLIEVSRDIGSRAASGLLGVADHVHRDVVADLPHEGRGREERPLSEIRVCHAVRDRVAREKQDFRRNPGAARENRAKPDPREDEVVVALARHKGLPVIGDGLERGA
mgnify:CR=1 FL=1